MSNSKRTYKQITAEIERLQKAAEAARATEVSDVIRRVKEAIAAYGITAADLGFKSAASPARGRKAGKASGKVKPASKGKAKNRAIKFRDANGNTWVGRGKRPTWLQQALAGGAKLEDFKVS